MQLQKPKHHERSFARGLENAVLVLTPLDLQHGRACLALTMVTHLATDQALSAQALAQARRAQQALQRIVAVLERDLSHEWQRAGRSLRNARSR